MPTKAFAAERTSADDEVDIQRPRRLYIDKKSGEMYIIEEKARSATMRVVKGTAPTRTTLGYLKPALRPGVPGILEKYQLPWLREAPPSFLDGAVSSFDFLGISKPGAGASRPHFRKDFKARKILPQKILLQDLLKSLGGRPERSR